ncbi:DUF6624 domain-containing protein [Rhodanobacter sp. L36]|uniref:DUF6624 domain-containing protein n=1 Tax=Rhodanobacter sp. L36 TaxID=1747221 RepID=UPI00131AC2A5|nr:DUF6624 domain-containing protein [Rhodanobacter sp. L36]
MEKSRALLAILFLCCVSVSPLGASDADDAQLAKRCPEFMAWQSAHPEFSNKVELQRLKTRPPTKPKLRAQLLRMVKADQSVRDAWIKVGMTTGPASQDAIKNLQAVDAANLKKFKPIILRQGFPGPAQVGVDGVEAAFLLVQHADRDPAFQSRVLPQLAALHKRGLISGQDLGLLTDRTLRARDKPQRYGTQYRSDNAHPEMRMQPVEDIASLDARRASMGMPPVKAYACVLSVMYHKPVVTEP